MRKKYSIPGQVTIFDIFELLDKQKTASGTAKITTIKHKVSKCKYQVVTKIYDSGLVVISAPELYDKGDECGWTSRSYKGYDEYIDIFESELGAWRYIRDERAMAAEAGTKFELLGESIPECITNPTKNKSRKRKTA